MQNRKNIAIILAAGSGERFLKDLPKQFAKVAGRKAIEHTVDVFQKHPAIDEIAIVTQSRYVAEMEADILKNGWSKVRKILLGGKERYQSSLSAIKAYEATPNVNLIYHDAVRPLISIRILDDVIASLETYQAVDVAIPATDTIIALDSDKAHIDHIPPRPYIFQGQTPQGFHLSTIKAAYEKALADPAFQTTDDCGVVLRYLPEVPIHVVRGEIQNIKLTYLEDLYFLDKLFQMRFTQLEGESDLSPLKDKVLVIFGGSSGIGAAMARLAQEAGARVHVLSRSVGNVDIRNLEDIQRALNSIEQKEGAIHGVACSAAVLTREAFHLMDPARIRELMDINYAGAVNVSYAAFEALRRSQGQLLHFTSSSYTLGRPFYSIYSSTKAAIVNFTQALAQEWEEFQIKVNCVNPERTATAMRTANFGLEDKSTLLKAEDVAYAALRVMASGLTGQIVDVRRNG